MLLQTDPDPLHRRGTELKNHQQILLTNTISTIFASSINPVDSCQNICSATQLYNTIQILN